MLDTATHLCYTSRVRTAPCVFSDIGASSSGRIAQLVEQLTLNQRVQGSNPCAPTNLPKFLGQIARPLEAVVYATVCSFGSVSICHRDLRGSRQHQRTCTFGRRIDDGVRAGLPGGDGVVDLIHR